MNADNDTLNPGGCTKGLNWSKMDTDNFTMGSIREL